MIDNYGNMYDKHREHYLWCYRTLDQRKTMLKKQDLNKKVMAEASKVTTTKEGKLSFIDVDLAGEVFKKSNRLLNSVLLGSSAFSLLSLVFGVIASLSHSLNAFYIPLSILGTSCIFIVVALIYRRYLSFYPETITAFSPTVSKWLKEQYNLEVSDKKAEAVTFSMLRDLEGAVSGDNQKRYRVARLGSEKVWDVQEVINVYQQNPYQYTTLTPITSHNNS